ncbi:MAG TPA: hypothetical protein DDY37_08015, partial [Legionella sp.]|nr:hypothetical protein [Legionella sp.]
MIKYAVLMMMPFLAIGCTHDEAYYRSHMTALQKVIHQCPENHPAELTCDQLKIIALRANDLADELRVDPQGFGQKILALQETISQDQASREMNRDQPALQASVALHQTQLDERLSIVKWL